MPKPRQAYKAEKGDEVDKVMAEFVNHYADQYPTLEIYRLKDKPGFYQFGTR